jgi:hypothetical protein
VIVSLPALTAYSRPSSSCSEPCDARWSDDRAVEHAAGLDRVHGGPFTGT